jgi:hypothetical protein
VCVCYNITLEEHNTQQRQQQQQQWMRRTGYSNKIYFSCQNLTTCRLYCIQISGSHVRLAVRVCARSIVYNRTTNLLALSWKSSQPNRPIFFSLSLSLSLHVRSLSEPVFRSPPSYRVPRKERHRKSLVIRFVTHITTCSAGPSPEFITAHLSISPDSTGLIGSNLSQVISHIKDSRSPRKTNVHTLHNNM